MWPNPSCALATLTVYFFFLTNSLAWEDVVFCTPTLLADYFQAGRLTAERRDAVVQWARRRGPAVGVLRVDVSSLAGMPDPPYALVADWFSCALPYMARSLRDVKWSGHAPASVLDVLRYCQQLTHLVIDLPIRDGDPEDLDISAALLHDRLHLLASLPRLEVLGLFGENQLLASRPRTAAASPRSRACRSRMCAASTRAWRSCPSCALWN